jgi:hypothetical protein
MKKIIPLLFVVAIFAATTAATNQAQKSFATANQEHGLYIFTDCRPNQTYQVLGTVSSNAVNVDQGFNISGLDYEQLKENIFKQLGKAKNKKKYTGADGLIFYPGKEAADVIKFE